MAKNKRIKRLSYRVPEVASILNVSPQTVRKFANNGKLANFRIGKMILIPADALQEFIKSNS